MRYPELSPQVCKGGTLDVECTALTHVRVFASYGLVVVGIRRFGSGISLVDLLLVLLHIIPEGDAENLWMVHKFGQLFGAEGRPDHGGVFFVYGYKGYLDVFSVFAHVHVGLFA